MKGEQVGGTLEVLYTWLVCTVQVAERAVRPNLL